jgi:preprotein translocase subunit SecD
MNLARSLLCLTFLCGIAAPAMATGVHMVLKVDVEAEPAAARERIMAQTLEIVRLRLGNLGISTPKIARQGSDRIVADVSNYADSDELRRVLSSAHLLSFRRVDDGVTQDDMRAGHVPPDVEIFPFRANKNKDAPSLAVYSEEVVSGSRIVGAERSESVYLREPTVKVRFDDIGREQFAAFTRDNVGRRFAIVLDGKILSAPTIEEKATGGSGEIAGHFTEQDAQDLALSLRAGAAPASWSLETLEQTP